MIPRFCEFHMQVLRLRIDHAHFSFLGGVADVTTSHVISSHEISCCGVAFSSSGRGVAAGDLAGNVWVTMETEVKTAFKCNVSAQQYH